MAYATEQAIQAEQAILRKADEEMIKDLYDAKMTAPVNDEDTTDESESEWEAKKANALEKKEQVPTRAKVKGSAKKPRATIGKNVAVGSICGNGNS